jgi:hypothetical protein
MKTVILVWTQKVINLISNNQINYWGIGDTLNCTIKLFELSRKMNFNFIVDIQHHPLSKYLIIKPHEYSELIRDNKHNIRYVEYLDAVKQINNLPDNELFYFYNNSEYNGIISEECKIFIKELLTPNIEFNDYMNEKIKLIPFEKYNIIHCRLGDSELLSKSHNNFKSYVNMINIIKQPNDILVTDSYNFKQVIKLNKNIFTFDIKPIHTGISTNNDNDNIKDTLFEFFLITKANKIKSYSNYTWISGFIKISINIYNVPYVRITNKLNKIFIKNSRTVKFIK